jgi:hypothetical protein
VAVQPDTPTMPLGHAGWADAVLGCHGHRGGRAGSRGDAPLSSAAKEPFRTLCREGPKTANRQGVAAIG